MEGPAGLRLLRGIHNLAFPLIQPLNWTCEPLTDESRAVTQ